jgi:hypothetical protein
MDRFHPHRLLPSRKSRHALTIGINFLFCDVTMDNFGLSYDTVHVTKNEKMGPAKSQGITIDQFFFTNPQFKNYKITVPLCPPL